MHDPQLLVTGIMAIAVGTLVDPWRSRDRRAAGDHTTASDRGAVSIEQVLWYAAAAISVAVVAAIIWSQIRTTASTPVQSPSAP
jgi:hypothetical protein